MQHKLFQINQYIINDLTIDVDILPNKYVEEQLTIDYVDFMDYMKTHGHLDGLPEMGLKDIEINSRVDVMAGLYDYIVARVLNFEKAIEQTETLVKQFMQMFKPF